ncbi:MAG: hypothetical protein J1F67_12570 [Muribaculaceae bacterium]|nr:hypothetical protein [Muribaculaceae bacterium]
MRKIGNHRAPFLDYHKPGIFMITMNKDTLIPDFSDIVARGDASNPGVFVKPSPIGKFILDNLDNFQQVCSCAEIYCKIIMPDHIHFLIYVKKSMELALGEYLAIFKRKIYHQCLEAGLISSDYKRIFEPGFNDLFINPKIKIKVIKNYIFNNPYNRWIRFRTPNYFRRIDKRKICGIECSLYGNLSLLDNPFIYPVIVHRKDSREELKRKEELWKYAIMNGGVLVGGFISKKEKEIFSQIFENNGRMILVKDHGFESREKPKGILNHMCEKGNLLIVSPKYPSYTNLNDFRQICLFNNSLAEAVGRQGFESL